eukprot:Lithocolla_globosa_v1_NODE_8541_length_809_cov_24.969496.p1 type:complete len:252 gc:universal NODE_8541_length_809_cov_24.969496:54-809(+)
MEVGRLARVKIRAFTARLKIDLPEEKVLSALKPNPKMSKLGEEILSAQVKQHYYRKFPRLYVGALQLICNSYTCNKTVKRVALSTGIQDVLKTIPKEKNDTLEESDVPEENDQSPSLTQVADAFRTLVATLHLEHPEQASRLIEQLILSRYMDPHDVAAIPHSPRLLKELWCDLGRKKPVARLEAQASPKTHRSLYCVGFYSGTKKLGIGYGPSKKFAEFQAAKNVLLEYFFDEAVPEDNTPDSSPYIQID